MTDQLIGRCLDSVHQLPEEFGAYTDTEIARKNEPRLTGQVRSLLRKAISFPAG
jgi:hypothetical protein